MKMTHMDASQEVLGFDSNTSGWMSTLKSGEDTTMHIAQTNDTNDAFLGRPVKIATIPWQVGTQLHTSFDPWSLFFENSKVINRLAHFKNLRATLHVKFQLNGSPFYYGRLMASYNPLPNSDDYTTARASVKSDMISASQRPKVLLDPTTNMAGELVCPFIFPKNTMDIPSGDWGKMGNVTLFTMNGLQHANDNGDPITITIFAYCSDYDLSTPTSQLPAAMTPQMDEYGIVSGPAHSLANWSGKLANAPVIGKYARATQMVAKGVGAVASLFGFSKPRSVEYQRNVVTGNIEMSCTNVPDHSMTLALDAKKEITIDPTVTGSGPEDEMAIIHLANKESYLTSFDWSASDYTDTHLFSVRVRPTQGDLVSPDLGLDREIHMTPSAWTALPFEYWTGSMEFRFQVVCSAYHRGRLRLVWDPDYYTGSDYNVNYSQIIDISNARDEKIKVGWGQNVSYIPVSNPIASIADQVLFPSFSTTPYTTTEKFSNGTLSVYVVNELTSPSASGETVEVNVFTNASADFELASPINTYVSRLIPTDDREYDPDPDNPRNPGGNPPPDDGPILAPGPDGNFPANPGDGSGGFVVKQVNPFAVLHAANIVTGADRPFNIPNWSNLIGVATDRAYLVNDDNDYLLYGRGDPGGTTGTSSFRFQNPSSNERPISITIGANTVSGTLPGFIGSSLILDVDVGFFGEAFDGLPVNIVVTGAGGRVILEEVGTIMKPDEDVYQYPLSVIATNSPDFTTDGSFLLNTGADDNGVVNAPGTTIDAGMPFSWIHTHSMTLEGQLFENDGTPGTTNAVPGGALWGGLVGAATATGINQPGDEKADILDFYTVARMAPQWNAYEPPITPEMDGVEGEEHEEVNAPEIETPTIYIGPPCVAGPSNQVYFGEQVASWRQILKRSTGVYDFFANGGGPTSLVIPQLPVFVGDLSSGTSTATDTISNIYRYVKAAYISERGSYRIKLISSANNFDDPDIGSFVASRIPSTSTEIPSNVRDFVQDVGFGGSCFAYPRLNGQAEVEVPWYSNYRFLPARSATFSDPDNFVERQQVRLHFGHTTAKRATIAYSSGEDYMLTNFLSVPLYLYVSN